MTTPKERAAARRAWTLRLALVLLASSFGWYTWFAFELARARMCYEHDGYPNVRGFCESPSIEIHIASPKPAQPNGPRI